MRTSPFYFTNKVLFTFLNHACAPTTVFICISAESKFIRD